MSRRLFPPDPLRVVLADANVIYSRVLRDYLLYAADAEIVSITWSREILHEVTKHLAANVPGFTAASSARLVAAMNRAFPYAEVEPRPRDYERLAALTLPDEDDRHVLAAALAAEATVLCTANIRDFPPAVTGSFGFEVVSPDALLSELITEYPDRIITVHTTSVERLPGATDTSTIAALDRAGAPAAAAKMRQLLEVSGVGELD